MLKTEFEGLIGKEVSFDTFRKYEAMYLALPETVCKRDFVAMLNITAIPEDPAAIKRREELNARLTEIRQAINCLKSAIQSNESDIERYTGYIPLSVDDNEKRYYKNLIGFCRDDIRRAKKTINTYKKLYNI